MNQQQRANALRLLARKRMDIAIEQRRLSNRQAKLSVARSTLYSQDREVEEQISELMAEVQ